jgi:hypothetical protein
MGKKNRIKPPPLAGGTRLLVNEVPDYNAHPPAFSLHRLQPGKYCLSRLADSQKAQFAEAIFKRKDLTWREITTAPRHGLGTEKISRDSIRAAMPRFITPEVTHFLALRFSGKSPMVGYRERDIFYVLWFDHDFTLYPHS